MLQSDVSSFVKPFDDGDIAQLTAAGFEGFSRKEIRSWTIKLQKQAGKGNLYLVKNEESLLLCGFHAPDTAFDSDSEKAIKTSADQASLWITPSGVLSDSNRLLYRKAISFLLYESFFQRRLHKVTLCVESQNSGLREILEENGFRKEGVLTDHYSADGLYDDGLLYAMLASEFSHLGTGLVPFLSGYLVLRTTNDAVFSVTIVKEGEDVPTFIDETFDFKNQISADDKIIRPSGEKTDYCSAKAYPYLKRTAEQLFQYTKGILTQFDLAFEYAGATEFQKQVWAATIQIPYGQTRTYEEIAFKMRPRDSSTNLRLLSRSVGTALGKNPIMIAIPCHRVIGKDGKLKGFAGGLEVKDFLLSHEMLFLK